MIRLGVIGHGNRISGVIKDCLRPVGPEHQREELRVVGIVDPDVEGARSRLAAEDRDAVFYDSVDDLVRQGKPDALLIGTRCNLHAPYAVEAARYDLPLYLEKPIAVTMEQALAVERAFEDSRCPVLVSFPLRVSPLCEKVDDELRAGAVGTPEHIEAFNFVPYGTVYWERGYRDYDVTRGLFLQKATHDFDYMMFLLQSPIVQVTAMANHGRVFGGRKPEGLRCSTCADTRDCPESPRNRLRNGSGGITDDHVCPFSIDCGTPETGLNEDCASALVRFASGAHGVYSQVFFTRRDAGARGATISGYHGTLRFDWYTNDIRVVCHHQPFSHTIEAGAGASHFGGDAELAQDFLDLIRGWRKESRTPIETGLRSVYACLAAKESCETGQFVEVRQVGG